MDLCHYKPLCDLNFRISKGVTISYSGFTESRLRAQSTIALALQAQCYVKIIFYHRSISKHDEFLTILRYFWHVKLQCC